MATVPISDFEHRVAQWATRIQKTREPLEVLQRGRSHIVVLDKQTFDEWKAERERLQALEIKLLVDEGARAFSRGRSRSHQAVGKLLRKKRTRE
jgi:PHD/YefM family antitoxin component YafN of YafNO toxin-antitoxin module